jgi:hypothetical protein
MCLDDLVGVTLNLSPITQLDLDQELIFMGKEITPQLLGGVKEIKY